LSVARGIVRVAAAGVVAVGIATPLVRRRLELRPRQVALLTWPAPVALTFVFPRTRLRDAAVYALQMWAYTTMYQMPNDDPDRLRERLRVDYPIQVDRAIGMGELPTVRLQRRLARVDDVRKLDVALSLVHWAWFFMPHASLAYVLIRHPEQFERSAARVAAVFDVGLVGYWAVPTAPPWWAGNNGNAPRIRRIMVEVGERIWGRAWRRLYDSIGANPFAAMPSLHFATSAMAAFVLQDVGRAPGLFGWAYTGVLGFGLLYLGEHYVIDLIAGGALMYLIRRLIPAAAPPTGAMSRALSRLSPQGAG
jgi:membrane-associated phospholipid phosphatase